MTVKQGKVLKGQSSLRQTNSEEISLILGIETALGICGVSLVSQNQILAEYNLEVKLKHSDLLFPLIEKVVNQTNLKLKNLSAIAVSIGPGSFTGIRMGVTVARTLGQCLEIPLVGVVTLNVLVENLKSWTIFQDPEYRVCPLIDALGNKVFTALYKFRKESLRLTPYQMLNIDDLFRSLKRFKKIIFLGNGAILYQRLIKKGLPHQAVFISPDLSFPKASSVACLGIKEFRKNKAKNFEDIFPFYLKEPEAKIRWK